jgi:tetratricopeptide (TPR) repeat protein
MSSPPPAPVAPQPADPAKLFGEATRQHQAGPLPQAERLYPQVLAARPDHAEALYLQGVLASQAGRHDLAVELIGAAIVISGSAPAYRRQLGIALEKLGRADEAAAAYEILTHLQPDSAEAWAILGVALVRANRLEEAVTAGRRAAQLKPDFVQAHANLGVALERLGRFEEAVAACREAVRLKPDFAEAHSSLGAALLKLGQIEEAAAACREAVRLRPGSADVQANLGAVLERLGRFEEAVAACREAIRLRPGHATAHSNLGAELSHLGRCDEAVACCREAVHLEPDHAEAHSNLAHALLKRGDLAEGWQEYEWRWRSGQLAHTARPFSQPQWRGEAASGRTLLIHAEQGLGDTLQFCRYAPLAAARRLRVVLEVPPPLVRLLRSLPGIAGIVPAGETLPPFDLHCPMLSLPGAFDTTPETIPGDTPYLHPDPAEALAWRARLEALPGAGPRIGLAWGGGARLQADRRRSIPPEHLAPLMEVPGVRFVSLQKGGPAAPFAFPLIDFMDEIREFADTAALMAALDLVISVDTAVLHLAGALGRKVWLLDRFDHCWRWMAGRVDTPWYPGLRIYRQPHPGDWACVIDRVALDLRGMVAAGGFGPSARGS